MKSIYLDIEIKKVFKEALNSPGFSMLGRWPDPGIIVKREFSICSCIFREMEGGVSLSSSPTIICTGTSMSETFVTGLYLVMDSIALM